MKNKMIQKILIIFITIMMVSTSPVFAVYTFRQGTNIITVDEYENGVDFKVEKTGIYAINLLPSIDVEGYEWEYTLINKETQEKISLALAQDGVDSNGDPIYKLYSKSIPYVLLLENKIYTLQSTGESTKNKLIANGSSEKYMTINVSGPTTTESGKYAELHSANLSVIEFDKSFPLYYYVQTYYDGALEEVKSQQANVPLVLVQDLLGSYKNLEVLGGEKKADLVQQLLTAFLVEIIGDGIMFLIGIVAGEPITIDKIIFNEYSRTRLAFFEKDLRDEYGKQDPNKVNNFLSTTGVLPQYDIKDGSIIYEGTLNKFFNRFTMIAIVIYIGMLLYMGIRIVLSSTGKDMAKYKKFFADWLAGVLILFIFPYVIRYTIKINNAIVEYIGTLRNGVINIESAEIIDYPGGLAFPFNYVGSNGTNSLDYMSQMRQSALDTGRVVYALCWLLMIKELIGFFLMYIKRLLVTLFLIVIFPLVSTSYAIDKIADGKSQAFNQWIKEFVLNVFLQTFHAINYVVVMGIIFAIGRSTGQTNFILIILGLTYLAQGDKILRGIFSQMKGGRANTVKDVAESFFATQGAINILKSSANTIRSSAKNIRSLSDRRLELVNKSTKLSEKKANDKWDHWNLSSMRGINNAATEAEIDQGISNAANIILDNHSSVAHIQQAVGHLREASMAGGDVQARYEKQMAELQKNDPERYQELMDLMDQSDAVDAMLNIENLTETELNAHLNVLVKNRVKKTDINGRMKKGNFIKLENELEKKGLTRKRQDELQRTLKARELTEAQRTDLRRVRASVCTKEDAARLAKLRTLEERSKELLGKPVELQKKRAEIEERREKLENKIAELENDLMTKSMRGIHKRQKRTAIARNQAELAGLEVQAQAVDEEIDKLENNGLGIQDRRELFEIKEKREALEARLTNKQLTPQVLEKTGYDRATQVAKYRTAAQAASGEMPSEEQIELAEAQAIIDGSDSGQYSLDEIWKACKVVKKARKKAGQDKGIQRILELAQTDAVTAKPEGFEEQVAALVVKNKGLISGDAQVVAAEIEEAKEVLVENARAGGIYQHILDDNGLAVRENEELQDEIVNIGQGDSLKAITGELSREIAKERRELRKAEGEVLTDAESVRTMRNELFAERLNFVRDTAKTAVEPVVKATVGMAAAGMYAGAASDYSPVKTMGATTLANRIASSTKDAAVDIVVNRAEKFADKISGLKDSRRKGELNLKKFASVMIYDDDNNQGVQTRNMQIAHSQTRLAQETRHEKQILQEIAEKQEEINRIEARREMLRRSINRANSRNSDENEDEETNNS